MGIWLFDEKERKLALNLLQTLLSPNSTAETVQLKAISFTDLLGVSVKDNIQEKLKGMEKEKEKDIKPTSYNNNNTNTTNNPSILDLLSKAKLRDAKDGDNLTREIKKHFSSGANANFSSTTSLKDFTHQTCEFLRANPRLLASLHRDLVVNVQSHSPL